MSTILDALKKSEQDRKRSNTPVLSDMPAPREPSPWPLVVGIVLTILAVVIIAFIGWWWFKHRPQEDSYVPLAEPTNNAQQIQSDSPATTAKSKTEAVVVNVVSYSEVPEKSFVMINGQLYRENQFIRAGLKVEKINPDSVVLNHRGQRIVRQP